MDKVTPVFSIIITAFNQEDCIKVSINSLLKQTFKDFEIIIVDDYSTDNTRKILQAIQKENPNIKLVFHEKNSSTFMARLSGINTAVGKYTLFLDGDDSYFEDALQRLYEEVIQVEDFDVCEFSYLLKSSNQIINPNIQDNVIPRIKALSQKDAVVSFWDKLYKTEIVQNAFKGIPVGYMTVAEDWYQSVCVALETKKFIQKNIPVYIYNDTNGITNRNYDFIKNEKNLNSINTVLSCMKKVLFEKTNENLADEVYTMIEKRLYEWSLIKIKYQTIQNDIYKSYLLLPKFFPVMYYENDFKNLYKDALKYRKGCFSFINLLKYLYHKIK